jgi:hypothetical protein
VQRFWRVKLPAGSTKIISNWSMEETGTQLQLRPEFSQVQPPNREHNEFANDLECANGRRSMLADESR